jgi:hypothetical protein
MRAAIFRLARTGRRVRCTSFFGRRTGKRHRPQAGLHVLRSDCQQISAHPSERNAAWMSARLSYRTRRRRNWLNQAKVPSTTTATDPSHSHARCAAWPARARCDGFEDLAEWRPRRNRDPRAHSLAAVAVAPVRRAAGESHRPTPGLLASRSDSRRSDARRAARLARRKSDGACSRACPDRWDSDRSDHRHTPRGWNNYPRPLVTNQCGRTAPANRVPRNG